MNAPATATEVPDNDAGTEQIFRLICINPPGKKAVQKIARRSPPAIEPQPEQKPCSISGTEPPLREAPREPEGTGREKNLQGTGREPSLRDAPPAPEGSGREKNLQDTGTGTRSREIPAGSPEPQEKADPVHISPADGGGQS
jgi:hypothetical protein